MVGSRSTPRRRTIAPTGLLFALFALLALFANACARPPAPELSGGAPACIPDFPYTGGWLGGDAAYSVELPSQQAARLRALQAERPDPRRTLWLFGDSFVAPEPRSNRVDSTFIHNSIGLSECGADGFEIRYYWHRDDEGHARAFFDSGDEDRYWWLFDGFVHEGALYVGLLEIEPAPPEQALGLPFQMAGMRLARVDNPSDPPDRWRIETSTLSRSREAFPGAAMLVSGEYVYLFAFSALREGRQPRFLSRLPLSALDSHMPADLSGGLETLDDSGKWLPGFRPDRARLLMSDNASEMSVEYDTGTSTWLAIYGSPIQSDEPASSAPSDQIYLRTAERLEGPWSERTSIHRIEELGLGIEPLHPNLICYAAKGHQRFAPPAHLLLTYVCNLTTPAGEDPGPGLQTLVREMDIYRPYSVIVPLPQPLLHSAPSVDTPPDGPGASPAR